MDIFISQLKLPGDSEFVQRFNVVSDAFQKWEEAIGTDKENELFNEWFQMKYCLEQGLPISEPIKTK